MGKNQAKPIAFPDGRTILPEPGPCLWCGQYVESDRDATGATGDFDASWTVPNSGDFGCDRSPWTGEGGAGDHDRPYDLARRMMADFPAPLPSASPARDGAK